MKYLMSVLLLCLAALNAGAVNLKIFGKQGELLFESEIQTSLPSDVGTSSIQAFDAGHIRYEGGVSGISKIFELGQDIDVLSDTEMKAYGWCFAVNGSAPDTMPDQTPVISQDTKIEWYYAYAHYKNGLWIGQCVRPH
jgi:hypothetical protein